MAKKRKKKNVRSKRANSLDGLSTAELLNRSKQFLEYSKFREAIACCKQVVKNNDLEDDGKLFPMLEQAYLGRIEELSAKEMFKEALVLLENMVRSYPWMATDVVRLNLSIRSGQYSQAAALYPECKELLSAEQLQRLNVLLGALLLTDALALEEIEPGSSVVEDFPLAQKAVRLFTAREYPAMQEVLAKISFRSPFKDLRLLLAGASQLSVDSEKARVLLEKITQDSPYCSFAEHYLNLDMLPGEIFTALSAQPKENRLDFLSRHGLDPQTCRALQELVEAGDQPEQLYRFLQRHASLFSREKYLYIENNLLMHCGEFGIKKLNTSSRPPAEKLRQIALAAEQDGAGMHTIDVWDRYLTAREKENAISHKEKAIIYRHMADLLPPEMHSLELDAKHELLQLALKYDPAHAETWLKAARSAKRNESVKEYYALLNDAMDALPDNVDILLAGMNAAAERGAFKKASRIADQVLALDPINIKAQDFVVESHLEHARKLVQQKKWHLVENELLAAGTRVKSLRFRGRHRMGLGMVRLLQQNEQGLEDIRAGKQENGSLLFGALLTSLEARLYQIPQKWQTCFDRELKKAAADQGQPNQRECLRIVSWLTSFPQAQQGALHGACRELGRYFSKAADLEWSSDDGLSFCRILESLGMDAALLKCARHLAKKYPARTEFEVWRTVAEIIKAKRRPGLSENTKLATLFDELEQVGQFEFVDYIIDVLRERRLDFYDTQFDFEEDIFGGDIDMEDFLEEVFKPPKPKPAGKPGRKPPPKKEAKPKPKSESAKEKDNAFPSLTGRQLNLFGDDT